MTNPTKKSQKAPELAKMIDLNILRAKVENLEALLEVLLFDIQGERGEKLRKRFYGEK